MAQALKYLEGRAKLVIVGSFSDHFLEKEMRKETSDELQVVGQVPYERVASFLEGVAGMLCSISTNPLSSGNRLVGKLEAVLAV